MGALAAFNPSTSARLHVAARWTRSRAASFYGVGSPLAAVAQLDPQTRIALAAEVQTAVDAYANDRGLLVPMEAHVVAARRVLPIVDPER